MNFCFSMPAFANCFVITELNAKLESDKILYSEGNCEERVSPGSTFKIALALMGFEEGILNTSSSPVWSFKEDYRANLPVILPQWEKAHDPSTWIKNSCIWYSQVLTQKMGLDSFRKYVRLFNYGNLDITGDKNKQNGLTYSWLSSSLKISPLEQVVFISKILKGNIEVSENSIKNTKDILYVLDLSDHWQLFGKTGSGFQLNPDGTRNKDRLLGWFVGWIHNNKDSSNFPFAYLITDYQSERALAGLKAKEEALVKIKKFIEQKEFHSISSRN